MKAQNSENVWQVAEKCRTHMYTYVRNQLMKRFLRNHLFLLVEQQHDILLYIMHN